MLSYRSQRLLSTTYSCLGAALVSAGLLHATYTGVVPWLNMGGIAIALLVPAFFIGVVNLELKDAIAAMFAAVPLTILFAAIARASPGLFGIVPGDVFFFYEIGRMMPTIFPLVPTFVIGVMAGILAGEFVFHLD